MRMGTFSYAAILLAFAPTLTLAQNNNWAVQPAPQSWGMPQPQPTTPYPPQAPVQQRGARDLNDAVRCSAALQLATMAAPNWARERGVTDSTNAWLQKVFELAAPQGIEGDRVPALVEAEMQRQVDDAANDPANLSRRAFDCASRQP
jgi:hypothetical protein